MIIKRDGSLTTGTTLSPNNLWAGSAFEYLSGPTFISVGLITPGSAGGLLTSFTVGGMTIAEEYLVPFNDPAVRGTDYPMIMEAYLIQAAGVSGNRVVSTLRNPTGGTLSYSGVCQLTAAGGRRR